MINIDSEDDMQLIVMATKLLTAWRAVKTRTVSIQFDIYRQLKMRVKPLMAAGNSEKDKIDYLILPKTAAIKDLKVRYRLFEQKDYDDLLRRNATGESNLNDDSHVS